MSIKEKTDRDFLGSYMNPGKIEKAPDGFTKRLMQGIEAETPTVKDSFRLKSALRIPAIAAAITAGLIVFSVFAGQRESSLFKAISEKLKHIPINLPEFEKVIIPEFSFPQILVYISVGLLVLWLLDLSLNQIFNRSRS